MKFTIGVVIGLFGGVLLTDFVTSKTFVKVVPIEELSNIIVRCSLFGGKGVITVHPPSAAPTIAKEKLTLENKL